MSLEPKQPQQFDLANAFERRQDELAAKLKVSVAFTTHSTTIGDASEADWGAMLASFLPGRYGVGPIFAVDSRSQQSLQVDLAVYDRQYSPLFFASPGSNAKFVPIECVYAVFEVKQQIDAGYVDYAANNIASVRRLHRTSADVYHLQGISPGKKPADQPILGGIIAARSDWTDIRNDAAVARLTRPTGDRHLDLGIALDSGSFDISNGNTEFSPPGTQLIYFALHLFKRLRPLATALSPELDDYEQALSGGPQVLSVSKGASSPV